MAEGQAAAGLSFSGALGGPMAWFAKFVGENLGAEVVPIEWADDGRRHRVRIGDLGAIEVEDFRAPQTHEQVAPWSTRARCTS